MKIKIIKEVYKKKSCKKKTGESGNCEVTTSRGKSCYDSCKEAAAAIESPKNEEQLEEMSMVGSVQGYAGGLGDAEEFNKKEKEISRLKGKKINEMFSTASIQGGVKIKFKSLKTHKGHVERSKLQGIKNVLESDEDTKPLQGEISNKKQSTSDALIKFANIGHIKSKRNSLWKEFLDKYGLETLANAISDDSTAPSRIEFIKNQLGSSRNFTVGIENKDLDTIRDYYYFLINEYLFWSYYNPHASPVRYADTAIKVPTAAKNLIRGHISRYISNPSRNNPASLSRRSIGKDSSSQKIYKDKPTLDDPLYDLPE